MKLPVKKATGWSIVPVLILLVSVMLASCAGKNISSGKARSLDIVCDELAGKVNGARGEKKYIRLAVLAVQPGTNNADQGFGEFFADRLTASLKKFSPPLRLFERKRLNDILKEHSLGQSGVIGADDARKVGSLLPLDALCTGSYVKLAETVQINIRLIDVVTGEILMSYSAAVIVDGEMSAFFRSGIIVPEGKGDATPGDVCSEKKERLESLLSDLSTGSKINDVVEYALTIPFEEPCGYLHESVLYAFLKYKINNREYRRFLIRSFNSTDRVESMKMLYTAFSAMKYFAMDGEIDDEEWEAGFSLSKRLRAIHYYNVYFQYLLKADDECRFTGELRSRIDEYFKSLKKGQMGLPRGIDYTAGFMELMGAVTKCPEAGLYIYEKYHGSLDRKYNDRLYAQLKGIYGKARGEEMKLSVLRAICAYFNESEVDEKSARNMVDFLLHFENRNETPPKEHQGIFIKECRETLGKAMQTFDRRMTSERERRINLCLQYDLPCGELAPSVNDLADRLLYDDSINKKREAAELLARMGKNAKKAEKNVIKVLGYIDSGRINGYGSPNLQWTLLDILGNLETRDPAALALIASSVGHKYSDVLKSAIEACKKTGPPVVPYLLKMLDRGDPYKTTNVLKALGEMGAKARGAAARLRSFRGELTDEYMKDKVDAALKKIQ